MGGAAAARPGRALPVARSPLRRPLTPAAGRIRDRTRPAPPPTRGLSLTRPLSAAPRPCRPRNSARRATVAREAHTAGKGRGGTQVAEQREVHIRGQVRGSAPVPLSVLDLATVGTGSTATDALRTSAELAGLAERRGYHRFWVAEHHSVPGVASSSPAVILAHLAAGTRRIRLGSGGVMLPNHAPLVIAEQFGTLEALAPGRIDLGLGRAPGT
ncbi:MsnO8 family LLM class oxidoreductase, partial [Streptomyces sparsus]